MPGKMLVAVDLSKVSNKLIHYACSLSCRLGIESDFVHVLPHPTLWKGYDPWIPPELGAEISQIARKKISYYMHKAIETMPLCTVESHNIIIEEGNPSDVIIRIAQEGGYSLVLVGYKGQSTIERLVVGSTAANVARYAPCSVLIYRPELDVF